MADTTTESGSHGLRTHWERFFRVRQRPDMDEFETVDAPRGATSREWEVFCRADTDDALRHAGSVSAPSAAIAREQATQLFGHAAEALWLCPADETVRLQREGVGVGTDTDGDATMDETTMHAETLRGENG